MHMLQLLRKARVEHRRALCDRGVVRQSIQFLGVEFARSFALERQARDLHCKRFMQTTRRGFVLHLALQTDEQRLETRFVIRVNRELGPRALRVDELGQRHFIGLGPALHLRHQNVGLLRRFVARLQINHAVVACFANAFVVITPMQMQFFQKRHVDRRSDRLKLDAHNRVAF